MSYDPWKKMRLATQARIGLARVGYAVGTKDLLAFQAAHAGARDAVLKPWDSSQTMSRLVASGAKTILAKTKVGGRQEHLKRPDLGRELAEDSREQLAQTVETRQFDIVCAVTDGLSARAIESHFVPLWEIVKPLLQAEGYHVAPIVLVPFGRVALSDEIGEALKAKLVLMFVGERPGLSSADSLGIYLTFNPSKQNTDANRNCISNVRPPAGLDYETTAAKLMFLIRESLRRKLSGVELKEDAEVSLTGEAIKAIR